MNVCKSCAFWVKVSYNAGEREPTGDCHRFPPTENKITHNHPRTTASDWCGEFAAREKGDSDE